MQYKFTFNQDQLDDCSNNIITIEAHKQINNVTRHTRYSSEYSLFLEPVRTKNIIVKQVPLEKPKNKQIIKQILIDTKQYQVQTQQDFKKSIIKIISKRL